MDILLIDPPYAGLKGLSTDIGYNLGLTSLAAYLADNDIETGVVMGDLLMDLTSSNAWLGMNIKKYAAGQRQYEKIVQDDTHIVWKKLTDYIIKAHPMAVGMPYLTPLKNVVEKIAGIIKALDPAIKVIAGAYHPTFCPDEVMQNKDIDFVVRGEGEIPLLALVKELKKDSPGPENVAGICYRDRDGQVHHTPDAGVINNLDELPFPARHLVLNCDYKLYRLHSMASARGCPYSCAFCADNSFWSGRVRRRSVNNVIAELRHLKKQYHADTVDFVDGTFTYDRKYLQAFCNALIEQKVNIRWRCTARFDNINEEILQLMKQANCTGLYLGLESGSDRVLKAVGKRETIEDVMRASKMVFDSGIQSATSILMGLPDENAEDIEHTFELIRSLKTDLIDVNCFVPLSGTRLYDSMSEEDRRNIDWGKVAYKSFDNYFTKQISQEEFRSHLVKAYKLADAVKRRTIIRLGPRLLGDYLSRKFRSS